MTKITLMRVDGDAKHEVEIPVGETIIGRGPVMQCTDKRVSRTHAQIKVSEDGKIELTSTSQNPCYYKDGKVISKSTSIELSIGDQFSFLPDSYCYCVKDHQAEGAESPEEMASTGEEPMSTELTANKDGIAKEANVSSLTLSDSCIEEMIVPPTDADIATDTSSDAIGVGTYSNNQKNGPTDVSLDSVKKYVPRWLLAATERVNSAEGEPSVANADIKKTEESDTVKREVPPKRKINDDHAEVALDDTVKKVVPPKRKINEVQHVEVAPVPGAHQLSDDSDTEEPTKDNHRHATQSVDTEHTGAATEKVQSNPDSPGSSHSPSRSARDSCRYGASCYRKNPQHRAEFSHPGDPDYKEDNRPECPYGTECYRKNPLHKQNYRHTKTPLKKPPKKRQKNKGIRN